MKKTFTILIAAIAAIMLIIQPMKVVGQTFKKAYTFSPASGGSGSSSTNYAEGTDITCNSIVWNAVANTSSATWNVGGGKNAILNGVDRVIYSKTAINKNISKINIAHGTKDSNLTVNSMTLTVHSSSDDAASGSNAIASFSLTFAASDTVSAVKSDNTDWTNCFYRIVYNVTTSQTGSNYKFQFKGGTFYETVSSDPVITIDEPTGGVVYLFDDSYEEVSTGDHITAGTTMTLDKAANTGYSFTSWKVFKTGDENTTVTVNGDNEFDMPSYNTTASAIFTKNNYNITLGSPDGCVLSGTDNTTAIAEGETKAYQFEKSVSLTAGSMVSGKMFVWKVVKTGVTPEADVTNSVLSSVTANSATLTVPAYDVTVNGIVEDIKYNVIYDANGGTGTLTDINSPYNAGSNVTVLDNTFTYSGHVFTEWNTEAGGDGTPYDAGDEISDIDADVTLYAQWADAWTVTFNSNAVETISEVEKMHSIVLPVPDNVPDGYVYKGWTATPATPHVMVGNPFVPTANVTLYAVFGKTVQEYGEISVILDGQGLTTTALSQDTERTVNGFSYVFAKDIKGQTVSGTNQLSAENAILAPVNTYIYNTMPFGERITKFEVFANQGASGKAAAGIYFSNSVIASYQTGDNTWTQTLSTTNNVYDASSKLTSAAKYFWFKSTSTDSKAAQVQFRITYIAPIYYTRIYPSGNITPDEDMTITTPTVISDGTVLDMGTHTLSIGAGGSLTIEDGGQLVASNSVAATVKKTIADPAKTDYGHWYTISTPVHKDATDNVVISETNLTTMGASNYDMFYFYEAQGTWINQKTSGTGFSNMYVGQGYLYRNNGTDLVITGNTNYGDIEYTLTKDGSGDIAGFNLIGNPYPHDINLKHITYGSGDNLVGFYRLSNAGAWGSELGETEPIHSYEGFLVQADVDDKVATFHETAQRGAKSNGDNIKFIVANSQYEDVAYALFDKGFGLSKINHRNADIPMLYINQEDTDYAIATMSDDTKSFNLNFKAMTTGKYTLSYKADGNFSYLHVIDRLTGEDVDMLLEGEYSFIASPIDSENRFIVRLEYSAGSEISESSIFAYQSGNDIIVNGEGELQIFDMMGRRVLTQYVSGVETINLQLNGVFIFRLNEKTQKIVVR